MTGAVVWLTGASQVEQVGPFGLVETQRARDGVQHRVGDPAPVQARLVDPVRSGVEHGRGHVRPVTRQRKVRPQIDDRMPRCHRRDRDGLIQGRRDRGRAVVGAGVLAVLGALFLLVLTGIETDLRLMRRHARTAFGVSFDRYFLESSLYADGKVEETVRELIAHGPTYEEGGPLCPGPAVSGVRGRRAAQPIQAAMEF